MRLILVLACFAFEWSDAKVYDKCELAAELKFKHGFSEEQVQNWVCIAEYESTFDSSAINHYNWDRSKDYGLFQLNNRYWCGSDVGDNVCSIECEALLDDDLTDDFKCVDRIVEDTKKWMQTNNGLVAWVAYVKNCEDQDLNAYIEECAEALSTPPVDLTKEVPKAEVSEAEETTEIKDTSPVRASSLGGATPSEQDAEKETTPNLPTRASGLGDASTDEDLALPIRNAGYPPKGSISVDTSANEGNAENTFSLLTDLASPPKGSISLLHTLDDNTDETSQKYSTDDSNIQKDLFGNILKESSGDKTELTEEEYESLYKYILGLGASFTPSYNPFYQQNSNFPIYNQNQGQYFAIVPTSSIPNNYAGYNAHYPFNLYSPFGGAQSRTSPELEGYQHNDETMMRSLPKFEFEKVPIKIPILYKEFNFKPINIDFDKFIKPVPQYHIKPIKIPKPEFELHKIHIDIPKFDLPKLKPINIKPLSLPKLHFNFKPITIPKPDFNFKPVTIHIPKPELQLKPINIPKINFKPLSIPKIKIKEFNLPKLNLKPIKIPIFELNPVHISKPSIFDLFHKNG